MTEARTTSIEEHVMRAARSYLYGHPLAWDVREGRIASQATARIRSRARRAAATLAVRVPGLGRPSVAVQPGSCS